MRNPDDRYQRVHIGPDHRTVLEHCTIDLDEADPVAVALNIVGVTACSLRFVGGDTLAYSKRMTA